MEKLRETNEFLNFYQLAADSMEGYKIAVVDTEYRYKIVSQQYLAGYGLSKAEIVGKSVTELMGKEVFNHVVKPKLDGAFKGQVIKYENWFVIPTIGRRYK